MVEWAIAAVLIGTILAGVIWCIRKERREWNGGRCLCGGEWEHFDNTSQGCRGYVCRTCKTYIWITYPGIDREAA